MKSRITMIVSASIIFLIIATIWCGFHRNKGAQSTENSSSLNTLPLVGTGPSGEKPATLEELRLVLSSVDSGSLQTSRKRIVLSLHDRNNPWSLALEKGVSETLHYYGLKLSAVCDGEFTVEKQIADIKMLILQKPDVLIVLPVDTKKLRPVLEEARALGITLIFVDGIPEGFSADEYVGWAVGDGYSMGKGSAELLAENLKDSSTVVLIHWKNSLFTVDRRSQGAREYFAGQTKVRVAEELYFTEFFEVDSLVRGSLERNKRIDGIWVVWDTPAFEAMDVLKELSPSTKVVTSDLGSQTAEEILSSSMLIGTAVDHPYNSGTAVALQAIGSLRGIAVPFYVVLPAQIVTKKNIAQAWQSVYHETMSVSNNRGLDHEN